MSVGITIPWLVVGDFNVISSWAEKSGGIHGEDSPLQDFNDFQLQAGLSDSGYSGNPYTLSNNQSGDKRIWERLDRLLINGLAFTRFPHLKVSHMTRVHSDHCPLLIEMDVDQHNIALFQYQQAWHSHPGFLRFVRDGWEGRLHKDPLINFGRKLKRLRCMLRKWNWEVFGDTRTKMRDMLGRIDNLEAQLQLGWHADIARDLHTYWLQQGDHNTSLFHASIKARRAKNKINLQLGDDNYTNDRDAIGSAAVHFYKSLFCGYTPPPPRRVFAVLDPVLCKEDSEAMCTNPGYNEVHEIILGMNKDSSPGPDGFTGQFYSHCWDVIKSDLMEAITGFFGGLQLPVAFSSTYLTLLPKVPNATAIDQLRPISLCNFCHKIISRILASRLAPWLPKIISGEQVGFIQGRSIHENIALAHDLAHELNHKVLGGNIIIKLDMAKAYDRISWDFILSTF
ncbi:hypothetical protein QQ045_032193 [Rhodiola kirilowii]